MIWLRRNKLVQKFIGNTNLDRLKTPDQITFFTSIHDFLKNGFSLSDALKFYLMVHPKLKPSINLVQLNLSKGKGFAESVRPLVNFRTYFQLQIAEFNGNLVSTLKFISHFLNLKHQQAKKVTGLMIYPIFLLIMLAGIILGIHWLVTPQLQTFNKNSGTGYLLWIIWGLIPVLLVGYLGWRYCHEQSRIWQINLLLKIPVVGKVYQTYYAYYLSSNLSMMMSCGMDLKAVVKFMKAFRSNSLIQELSYDVKKQINQGRNLNHLRIKYNFLPRQMMILLDAGDTTDVTAKKLRTYSKMEFRLMMKRASKLVALLQPLMFLIIGLLITGTYLKMLLPMYQSIKGVY